MAGPYSKQPKVSSGKAWSTSSEPTSTTPQNYSPLKNTSWAAKPIGRFERTRYATANYLIPYMHRNTTTTTKKAVLYFLSLFFLSSCVVSKKSVYFRDVPLDTTAAVALSKFEEPVIQSDDILRSEEHTSELQSRP